jgi:hypothetical protein
MPAISPDIDIFTLELGEDIPKLFQGFAPLFGQVNMTFPSA